MKPAPDQAVRAIEPLAEPPTLAQLFTGFFVLGMTAFGGALPLARRMMVEKHRWISGEEFTTLLGLCQFLPGGNIINLSVAIGMRFRGVTGAVTALLGFVLVPTLVVIMLGVVYDHYQHDPHVRHLFAGLAAAAAGLLISLTLKIGAPLLRNRWGLIVALLCFLAIAVLRLPLLPTMLALTPLSILITWRKRS
ncbi:chromate transporter [Bordetella genomosp. 9]|uniref:Chromate transporter n=1 Tax=Bordetella genomosp. 9 TaxID=1416803 RepID=A0A1W6Z0G3_9BORD|nr:chromate transporter [Bordetella genomosp. 9]ARP86852.1 chromate transporter [Bordetella genomosp. 9]ARP90838.1 chromate transporter [Bordetella genomosp. 9]